MVGVVDNQTAVSDNVLWSKSPYQAPILFGVVTPVIFWMIPGLMFLQGLFGPIYKSLSSEERSRMKDTILFTFISLSQATLVWIYLALTPYFISTELQITMLVFLFVGPQIASLILFAPYKDCFEYIKELLVGFGLTRPNGLFKCDSFTCVFTSILLIPKFSVAILVVGLIVTCYGVLGTLGAILFGYFALPALQLKLPYMIKGVPGKENARHLLNAIIVHVLCLSIPEVVMLTLNLKLSSVKEIIVVGQQLVGTRVHDNQQYLWVVIIFFILFGFELALGILYLAKRFGMMQSMMSNQAQPSPTTRGSIPHATAAPTAVQDSELAITDVQPDKTPVKTLDIDLEEPKLMNPERGSTQVLPPPNQTNGSANAQGAGGSFAVECTVCYTTGKKKKVLIPCGHMLCEECFVGIQTRSVSNILCPFCHQHFTSATDLYF